MADEPVVSAPATHESAPSTTQPEYEFSPSQNKVFADLAENLAFAGWFIIILVVAFHGVLIARWAIQGVAMYEKFRLMQVIWPLLLVGVSVQFILTGNAFQKVVDTQGSDISHLMSGLGSLNDAFSWLTFIPRLWILVALIAAVIGAVLGVIHWLGY